MRHAKKQEIPTWETTLRTTRNQTTDFKGAIKNIFKKLQETMYKEVEEDLIEKSHQIETINN